MGTVITLILQQRTMRLSDIKYLAQSQLVTNGAGSQTYIAQTLCRITDSGDGGRKGQRKTIEGEIWFHSSLYSS